MHKQITEKSIISKAAKASNVDKPKILYNSTDGLKMRKSLNQKYNNERETDSRNLKNDANAANL